MKLAISFGELDRVRRRMGAPLSEWRASVRWSRPKDLGHEPIEREIDSLDQLTVGPADTIVIEGRRVFLYIREFHVPAETLEQACNAPERLRRFHVVWCKKLREMRAAGKFERYVASERVDEPFGVAVRTSRGEWACGDAELLVCRLCLGHINWQAYRGADRKKQARIVEGFSRRRFLDTDDTRFAEVPRRSDKDAPALGYAADWAERSRARRRMAGWRCEDCAVDCSARPGLLDTHHQNGVPSDNRASNLRALCKLCHAKKHPGWYRVANEDRSALEALRRAQGL